MCHWLKSDFQSTLIKVVSETGTHAPPTANARGDSAVSRAAHLTRRLAFSVLVIYLVLSLTFGVIVLTPDPTEAQMEWTAARTGMSPAEVQEAVAEFRASRNLDEPVHVRYANWLVDFSTFQWGESFVHSESVTDLLGEAIPKTLSYLLPGALLAVLGGVGLGMFSAFKEAAYSAKVTALVAYALFGIPVFFLAIAVGLYWQPANQWLLPSLVLAAGLLAGQLRFSHTETADYLNATFVKLLRAKGASEFRVARHILKNAAVPLLAAAFTDLFAVMVLNVYVIERFFGINGLGTLSLNAILDRDLPLVIGTVAVIVFASVLLSFLQDVANTVIDPRIGGEA